jgi:hypothetical protein
MNDEGCDDGDGVCPSPAARRSSYTPHFLLLFSFLLLAVALLPVLLPALR